MTVNFTVYLREDRVIIPTVVKIEMGLFYETNPVQVLAAEDNTAVVAGITAAILRGNPPAPNPPIVGRTWPKPVVLDVVRVKSWTAFEKTTAGCGLSCFGEKYELRPFRHTVKGRWEVDAAQTEALPADTPPEKVAARMFELLRRASSGPGKATPPEAGAAPVEHDAPMAELRASGDTDPAVAVDGTESAGFVAELERHGFFRRSPPQQADALKTEIQEKGWTAIYGESGRLFTSDAEDLAEGGISELLVRLAPFLTAEGVAVPHVEDLHGDEGYSIRIGNRTKPIYSAAELRRESAGEPGLTWGLATARAFSFVNDLLEAAGSPERLYAVNGGNDLFGFFLTPTLHRLITEHPQADKAGGPYQPKAEYPTFGQPGV